MLLSLVSLTSILFFIAHTLLFKLSSHSLTPTPSTSLVPYPWAFPQTPSEADIWNCVSLYLGATYYPSMDLANQFWRVFTSQFVHQSLGHLALNLILIFTLKTKQDNEFSSQVFLLFCVSISNFVSSIIFRHSLIIGCSALVFALGAFRLCEAVQKREYSLKLAACLLVLGFAFTRAHSDHVSHGLSAALGALFFFGRVHGKFKFLWVFVVLSLLVGVLLWGYGGQGQTGFEGKFALDSNFGCFDVVSRGLGYEAK